MPSEPYTDVGSPDGPATALCAKCGHDVVPVDGRCPVHRVFLAGNTVAIKHPVREQRRRALLAEVVAEFPPSGIDARTTAEQLAGVLERLETLKPGSIEWQRLLAAKVTLRSELAATRTVEDVDAARLAAMSFDEVLDEAEAIRDELSAADPGSPPGRRPAGGGRGGRTASGDRRGGARG